MRSRFTKSLLGLSLLCGALAACSSTETKPEESTVSRPDRVPYTTNLEIKLGDKIVGYALRYDPIPLHDRDRIDRAYPTGTVLVQNARLEPAGFVTPLGAAYRYAKGESDGVVFSQYLENNSELGGLLSRILNLPDRPSIEGLVD